MTNASAIEIAAISARKHKAICLVTIAGHPVKGMRIRIRHGFGLPTEGGGQTVATCDLELLTRPSWLTFRQRVEVDLGYAIPGGSVKRRRFTGFVEDDGSAAWPERRTIKAVGYLRYADAKTPDDVTYASAPTGDNTRDIIAAILEDAGITDVSIGGDDTTLGTVEDVVLGARQSYSSLIKRIDHAHLDVTWDWLPSGRVRRDTITGLPAATASWTPGYEYPGTVLEIENPETVRDVRNRVEVVGIDDTAVASRRADSPYVRAGYDEVQEVSNDLIETAAEAAEVAALWMPSVNRITRRVRIRIPGNPILNAGDTVLLNAPNLSVPIVDEMLWLGECDEEYSERGYWMWLTLYGGKGESGYPVYVPYADFTWRIVVENFNMGAGLTTYYIVYCDGTASSSPDGSALTYAWQNDQTAAVSSEPTYRFVLTEAELDAPCVVSLTVTNTQGESDTFSVSLPAHDSGDELIEVRTMYLALETDCGATSDGGQNWQTTADNGTATPEIAAEDHSYFAVGAVLYRTSDFCASPLTAIHTFAGTTLTAVWINEMDANRVAVGCADGSIWTTADASSGASSTWTLRHDFASAVNWVVYAWDGVLWALVGSQVIADGAVMWALDAGYTAKRLALSFFSHYVAGDDGAGAVQVKRNDGVALTFSGATPARLGGLTHHISEDVLWAGDENGVCYRKGPGSTVLVAIATIGGGEVFHMVRDGTNPFLLWAACNSGLYKSYDGGYQWWQERAGKTLMLGYGSAPWGPITATTVVSEHGVTLAKYLWDTDHNDEPPANWTDWSYDDSGWDATVASPRAAGWTVPTGSESVTSVTPDTAAQYADEIYRDNFTLTAGVITSASLQVAKDDALIGLWINGIFLLDNSGITDVDGVTTISVSPSILREGDNVIAARVRNESTPPGPSNYLYVAWRLEVS